VRREIGLLLEVGERMTAIGAVVAASEWLPLEILSVARDSPHVIASPSETAGGGVESLIRRANA